MTSTTEETMIMAAYSNSADMLLSLTLAKITHPVTLEETRNRSAAHILEVSDPTKMVRNFRDRDYGV